MAPRGGASSRHAIQLTLLNVNHTVMSNICNHGRKHATVGRDDGSGPSAVAPMPELRRTHATAEQPCSSLQDRHSEYKASGRVHVP